MEVGADADAGAFLSFGDDLEQQFGAVGIDLDVAQFVEQQDVEAAVAADHPGQLPFVGGLDELVDQLGAGDVADPAALLAGGHAESDEQVGFPGAGVTEQHHRFPGVDPCPAGECGELGWGDAGHGVEVELGQPFGSGGTWLRRCGGPGAARPAGRPRR
jgi:hypothetical protein